MAVPKYYLLKTLKHLQAMLAKQSFHQNHNSTTTQAKLV